MSAHLTVLLSLGVAILLSPENLLIGLVMASDKKSPRLAALMYAVGAITVGMARPRRELWISRDSMRADEPTHPDDRGHSAGVKAAP